MQDLDNSFSEEFAMSEPRILVVLTTCDKKEDADRLAEKAVRKRLAACAQISGPITSYYWWKDSLEQAEEWQIRMKTLESGYRRLEEFILKNHSYELPQIVAFPAEKALAEFSRWVAEVSEGK